MEHHIKQVIQKRKEISNAIIAGLKDAERYDKPYDKYMAVVTTLGLAGYKIVKTPKNTRS